MLSRSAFPLMLPSSTALARNARPISRTSTFLFLNTNDDVRATTRKSADSENVLVSSSVTLSPRNSWSGFPVRLRNGNTAMAGSAVL